MKKYLMAIPYFLLWILYFLFTLDARNRYMVGESKGMYCYKIDDGLNSYTAHFNPKEKPIREYVTWKEFWMARGY